MYVGLNFLKLERKLTFHVFTLSSIKPGCYLLSVFTINLSGANCSPLRDWK